MALAVHRDSLAGQGGSSVALCVQSWGVPSMPAGYGRKHWTLRVLAGIAGHRATDNMRGGMCGKNAVTSVARELRPLTHAPCLMQPLKCLCGSKTCRGVIGGVAPTERGAAEPSEAE